MTVSDNINRDHINWILLGKVEESDLTRIADEENFLLWKILPWKGSRCKQQHQLEKIILTNIMKSTRRIVQSTNTINRRNKEEA